MRNKLTKLLKSLGLTSYVPKRIEVREGEKALELFTLLIEEYPHARLTLIKEPKGFLIMRG
jgi:hypothetical protein